MSREVKLGLLAFITIFLTVWGYRFIKGQNLLQRSFTYVATFNDVTGLSVSSDVLLNGYKIGSVTQISLNPQDVKKMDVTFRITDKVGIPKDALVQLKNEGLVGGKFLGISFDKPCDGETCAPSGTRLKSETLGLLGSMVSPHELDTYVGDATKSATQIINNLGKDGSNAKIDLIVKNLEVTMANMSLLTRSLNNMIQSSNANLAGMTSNMNKITKNLADNNAQITAVISNLNTTSKNFASLDLKQTLDKTNNLMDNGGNSAKKLEETLSTTNKTMADLNKILKKIDEGGGSLGLLLNDKKLYSNLESTSKNLSLLLQDLRLNPKRYVNVSLIGRKEKHYILPEEDPANKQ
jgi:phospholipid/cholesterol/gamma-HCH transport system substrate-binding protein